MLKENLQYTIRNVPERVDARLRENAATYGTSLNETVISALSSGLGLKGEPVVHHDLDDLIGSWVHDEACDRALAAQDRVDTEMWS